METAMARELSNMRVVGTNSGVKLERAEKIQSVCQQGTPLSSEFLHGEEALVYGQAEEKQKALNWAQQFPGHSDTYWQR